LKKTGQDLLKLRIAGFPSTPKQKTGARLFRERRRRENLGAQNGGQLYGLGGKRLDSTGSDSIDRNEHGFSRILNPRKSVEFLN